MCPQLDHATKVCYRKAPQRHPLPVNPPPAARWSGQATRGPRSRAPRTLSRGAEVQTWPRLSTARDATGSLGRWGPRPELPCTTMTYKHLDTYVHTRHMRAQKRSRHST